LLWKGNSSFYNWRTVLIQCPMVTQTWFTPLYKLGMAKRAEFTVLAPFNLLKKSGGYRAARELVLNKKWNTFESFVLSNFLSFKLDSLTHNQNCMSVQVIPSLSKELKRLGYLKFKLDLWVNEYIPNEYHYKDGRKLYVTIILIIFHIISQFPNLQNLRRTEKLVAYIFSGCRVLLIASCKWNFIPRWYQR
jgi:hypothetical protein